MARVTCRLSRRLRAAVRLLEPLPKKALLPLVLVLPLKVPLPRKLEFWLNTADMITPDCDGAVDDGRHGRVDSLLPGASAAVAAPAKNAPQQPPGSTTRLLCHAPVADVDRTPLPIPHRMPSGKPWRKAPLAW